MGGLRGHGVPRATVIRDRRVGDSAGNQGGTPTRLASPFLICPGPGSTVCPICACCCVCWTAVYYLLHLSSRDT